MALVVRSCSLLLLCCWMGSPGDGSEGFEGMPSSAWRGAIGLGRCGGWRFWPMEPWRWGNAVSAAVVDRLCSLLLRCCWMDSRGNGSGGFNGMPLSVWRGLILLGRSGGWRIWPLAPWRWGNAVSAAVVVRFCPLLRLCCWMGSLSDGSNDYDGVPPSAPSLARDGLGCHGQVVLAKVGTLVGSR